MGAKKKIAAFFREEAKKLPVEYYEAYHKYFRPEFVNIAKEGEEKNIQPVFGYIEKHPVNHGRRLRKIYQKEGKAGVDKYFEKRGFKLIPKEEVNELEYE